MNVACVVACVDAQVFKFRAPNEAEGQRWIEGLNAWRDHFLLNM